MLKQTIDSRESARTSTETKYLSVAERPPLIEQIIVERYENERGNYLYEGSDNYSYPVLNQMSFIAIHSASILEDLKEKTCFTPVLEEKLTETEQSREKEPKLDAASNPDMTITKDPIRVLDIGAGNGMFLERIKKEQPGITVLGISKKEERTSLTSLTNEEYIIGNADLLSALLRDRGLEENAFDSIFLSWTLMHVGDPAGLLKMAYKALKPGGILAANNFNFHGLQRNYCDIESFLVKQGYKIFMTYDEKNIFCFVIKKTVNDLKFPFLYNSTHSLHGYDGINEVRYIPNTELLLNTSGELDKHVLSNLVSNFRIKLAYKYQKHINLIEIYVNSAIDKSNHIVNMEKLTNIKKVFIESQFLNKFEKIALIAYIYLEATLQNEGYAGLNRIIYELSWFHASIEDLKSLTESFLSEKWGLDKSTAVALEYIAYYTFYESLGVEMGRSLFWESNIKTENNNNESASISSSAENTASFWQKSKLNKKINNNPNEVLPIEGDPSDRIFQSEKNNSSSKAGGTNPHL